MAAVYFTTILCEPYSANKVCVQGKPYFCMYVSVLVTLCMLGLEIWSCPLLRIKSKCNSCQQFFQQSITQGYCGFSSRGTQSVKFLDAILWFAGSSLWNSNIQIVHYWHTRIKLSLSLSYLKTCLVYTRFD